MKTFNYGIDLMLPMQTDKEIIFNEAQIKFDVFCNMSVMEIVDQLPSACNAGDKYILKNQIAYCASASKSWQYLIPQDGMIIFLKSKRSFLIYEDQQWNDIDCRPNDDSKNDKFIGISGNYIIAEDSRNLNLYINGDVTLDLSLAKIHEITVIIKQNHMINYKLTWPYNVLWSNNAPHYLTQLPNSIDVVKLFKMPESEHFLGQIISQNYKF